LNAKKKRNKKKKINFTFFESKVTTALNSITIPSSLEF